MADLLFVFACISTFGIVLYWFLMSGAKKAAERPEATKKDKELHQFYSTLFSGCCIFSFVFWLFYLTFSGKMK